MYNIPRGIIVSVQDTFSPEEFAVKSIMSGAVAIRCGTDLCITFKSRYPVVPVIGLKKDRTSAKRCSITATEDSMWCVWKAGANFISTGYYAYNYHRREDIKRSHCCGSPGYKNLIADIATLDQAKWAEDKECCAVATTLSGYTEAKMHIPYTPDIDLVEQCAKTLKIPVIAEGRYFMQDHVRQAFEAGAHSVCIGTAITRPDLMTKYFVEGVKL